MGIHDATCVRFFQGATEDGHYIKVTTNPAVNCESLVGYKKVAGQRLNLGPFCMNKGGITHELMHALGFQHEHQLPWREEFIQINLQNVSPENKNQFRIFQLSEVAVVGHEYDYDSVMHYGPYQGSANRGPVIVPLKNGAENMGNWKKLSQKDVYKVNTIYKCPEHLYPRGL